MVLPACGNERTFFCLASGLCSFCDCSPEFPPYLFVVICFVFFWDLLFSAFSAAESNWRSQRRPGGLAHRHNSSEKILKTMLRHGFELTSLHNCTRFANHQSHLILLILNTTKRTIPAALFQKFTSSLILK